MTACARRRTAEQERERKWESASAVSHAGQASPSLEFEETGVVAADPAREHHHHHHHRKVRAPETPQAEAATPAVEEEEPELDATHDMFADAGKFLLAGGMAGAGEPTTPFTFNSSKTHERTHTVSRTATAPFDRLKVYLITSPASTTTATDASGKRQRPGRGSLIEAVKTVYRSGGGVKAFWTGNGLNIVKIFPVRRGDHPHASSLFADPTRATGIGDQVPVVRVGKARVCAVLGQGAGPDHDLQLEPVRRRWNRWRHQPVLYVRECVKEA